MEFSRESIFHSSIRSFSHMFFGVVGFFIALIPVIVVLVLMSPEAERVDKNTITYLSDLEGNNSILPVNTPAILRINIHGIIGMENQTEEVLRSILTESRKGILKNNRVKGILLYISSPGGTVTASEGMYALLKEYKEKFQIPIIAYADGVCASGGYYISLAAEKIYSSPSTIIGSIGVKSGPFFNVTKTLEKFGIESLTVTSGKDKDMLSPFRTWKADEDGSLKDIQAHLYERFITAVSKARPKLTKDKLINDFGANVFVGEVAQANGYIDNGDVSYTKAISKVLEAAKIDEKAPYQLVELRPKKNRLKDLFNAKSPLFQGKVDHILHLGTKEESINDPFLYLYRP